MKVLVPLFNFNLEGAQFELARLGIIIKFFHSMPDLSNFKSFLTKSDIEDIERDVKYWLSFEQSSSDILDANNKINFFMLALWIVLPTNTQVTMRFESSGEQYSVKRYLNKFWYNKQYTIDRINNNIINKINEYIDIIIDIYIARKRLYNGLFLNLSGNFAFQWQVAFICFSAAMEAILTYSDKPGITGRLAKSFACLTEIDKSKRDSAYRRFYDLYKIRSDIMHGRAMNYDDENINLNNLNEFEILLRKVWQTILNSKFYIMELEKSDTEREYFFANIENGYQPPPKV
jgi:hypothetical protein